LPSLFVNKKKANNQLSIGFGGGLGYIIGAIKNMPYVPIFLKDGR